MINGVFSKFKYVTQLRGRFLSTGYSQYQYMADLIVVVFWHAHALDIPFPIGYRREHLGELEGSELRFRLCSHYPG